ncbi:MAG: hypothetical protein ACYC7B_14755 [Burkholderiales bacterium]
MKLRISLYVIAALLLGAHFLRESHFAMVALCLATPLLFFWRKRRSLMLLQFLAYCAAGTWIGVALQVVQLRLQWGQPWAVAATILGTVTLFTLLAGLLLNSRAFEARYP